MLNAHEDYVRVEDVMHPGILTCWAHAQLDEVAAIMARHHVYGVAVMRSGDPAPVGIVSTLDLAAVYAGGEAR